MIGKQNDSSLRTRRFETFCIAISANLILCVFGFYLKVNENLLLVGVGSLNVLSMAALGFGNWHDRGVRMKRAPNAPETTAPQVNIGIEQK